MNKEDLVIGDKYHLDTLEETFVGDDPKNEERVLLTPLNTETKEFYHLNKDGLVSLGERVFLNYFNPKN